MHNIELGIASYGVDNGDSYPAHRRRSARRRWSTRAACAYVDNWPENPWTGADMSEGSRQGDYTYTQWRRHSFTLVGIGRRRLGGLTRHEPGRRVTDRSQRSASAASTRPSTSAFGAQRSQILKGRRPRGRPRTTCSACSGPTAPARPPPSRWRSASCGRRPARSSSACRASRTSATCPRTRTSTTTSPGASSSGFCARLFGLDAEPRARARRGAARATSASSAPPTRTCASTPRACCSASASRRRSINDPELVLLDEPMTGLDPVGRVEVKRIIEDLHERGKTVLFNSHILSDVARAVHAHRHHARGPRRLAGHRGRGAGRGADARGLLHEGGDGVNQVVAIAVNTFKETIRDRVLAVIVVFALHHDRRRPVAGQHQPRRAGPHDEGLRPRRRHVLRAHRRRVRRRRAWCTRRSRSAPCSCCSPSR